MYKLNSTVVFGGGVCGAGAAQIALGRSGRAVGAPLAWPWGGREGAYIYTYSI